MDVKLNVAKPSSKSFTVKGKTIADVTKALDKNGFWGRYRSNMDSDWGTKDPVEKLTVNTKPVIILPEWSDYKKATKEEQKEWDRMVKVLTKHENRHHEILEELLADLKKELEAMDPAPSRDEIERRWGDFTGSANDEQDRYDLRTSHGVKEGVELTPP